jgi:hypothetical protein
VISVLGMRTGARVEEEVHNEKLLQLCCKLAQKVVCEDRQRNYCESESDPVEEKTIEGSNFSCRCRTKSRLGNIKADGKGTNRPYV